MGRAEGLSGLSYLTSESLHLFPPLTLPSSHLALPLASSCSPDRHSDYAERWRGGGVRSAGITMWASFNLSSLHIHQTPPTLFLDQPICYTQVFFPPVVPRDAKRDKLLVWLVPVLPCLSSPLTACGDVCVRGGVLAHIRCTQSAAMFVCLHRMDVQIGNSSFVVCELHLLSKGWNNNEHLQKVLSIYCLHTAYWCVFVGLRRFDLWLPFCPWRPHKCRLLGTPHVYKQLNVIGLKQNKHITRSAHPCLGAPLTNVYI